ncbi:MAG: MotA/TolQ/ExbB proton channel family protein [Burkholderiaceae bacterium]|jgi:biopolymer transport protein ExbB|nr:MAG: MotA/TolQ/ExbB proton channel family protein [Burkholderiaceae bacterium]
MTDNPYGIAALFGHGDAIIKVVALLLLLMSIASWYVIVTRSWRLLRWRRAALAADDFWHAKSYADGLELLKGTADGNPFRYLAQAGQAAVDHHVANEAGLRGQLSLAEWLTESLRGAIDECAERFQNGLPLLASVGATAPFVGLFGTVWGIYHALVGIGVAGQADIGQIAGPVGEALIMTAGGLAAAIPAVLAYNALTRANKAVLGRLNRFARQLHAYFLTGAPVARGSDKLALRRIGGAS